jgi:hypothetical protein
VKSRPAPAAKKEKSRTFQLDFPIARFPLISTFNQFGLEYVDSDLVIHLGYLVRSVPLASFSFILDCMYLQGVRSSWKEYLQRLGAPQDFGDRGFRCPPMGPSPSSLPTVNLVNWHQRGSLAEIRLFCVALGDLYDAEQKEAADIKVPAQPIALFRSPLEIHLQLLLTILEFTKDDEE